MSASLRSIALLFLRLGTISFGGPAAHLAMMQDEVVRRREWLSNTEFAELLAVTNLIPGPNSTEMAIHVGRRMAGWPGLIVAGLCFIAPAATIVTALAWMYVSFGRTPDARAMLAGINPVVLAIIVHAGIRVFRSVVRGVTASAILLLAFAMSLLGLNELAILFGCGFAMIAVRTEWTAAAFVPVGFSTSVASTTAAVSLSGLAFFFLKVGSVLFGSGYVLIAFLHADLVERWHWLSDQQLLDAVAVGQMTPGPVFTTATFIGYVLSGWRGALVATTAIFLPAFVFVALTQPLIAWMRQSRQLAAFLDGVVAASLGLMAAVTVRLGAAALTDPWWIAWSLAALTVLVSWNVNSAWLVLAGAVAGLLRTA